MLSAKLSPIPDTFWPVFVLFINSFTVLVDTKENKKKEKAKNWMIKTIEKSINRMKSVLHFMKHKFKYYFN